MNKLFVFACLVALSGCKSCSWPLFPGLEDAGGNVDAGEVVETDAGPEFEVDAGEAVILPAPVEGLDSGLEPGLELPPEE